MSQRIRELLEKRTDAAEAIKTAQGQITELMARSDQLQKQIASLVNSKQKAKAEKVKTLEGYADNANNKTDYDRVRAKLKDIEEAEAELNEILTVTEKAKTSLIESLPELERALKASEVEIWQEVYRDLSLKVTDSVREDIAKIFVAGCAGDCLNSYQDFINNLFPCPGEAQPIKAKLEKEFCEVKK